MGHTVTLSDGCKRLRAWMKRSNLTNQAEAAEVLEIGYEYFTKIHRGLRLPGRDLAVHIERKTGIPVDAWVSSRMDKTRSLVGASGRNA